MKRPFTIYDSRSTICRKSAKSAIVTPNSELRTPNSQKGVALIITLILLAVVTFMALTFLAVSRRERGAVTTTTDTASARLAADAALATAEAQIVANALAATNPYNFGLLVSTNYINPAGYLTAVGANSTNVNYYYPNGQPVSGNDFLQLLGNLYYSPRAPVLISTNDPVQGRFYLDLNHNGVDDPNGLLPETNNLGQPMFVTNFEVGDPEWIGVLQHPDQPYGPNNPFVARYAFIAMPIGNALDLNAIYNDAMGIRQTASMAPGKDGFMRNEGVGSWEINLAAFLTDLNTNQWDTTASSYNYREPGFALPNTGAAFDDALSLLSYRYNYFYNNSYNLASVNNLFGGAASAAHFAFENDNIDGYSDGPLQTGFPLPGDITTPQQNDKPSLPWSGVNDDPSLSWAGADNTNQFFDLQELFNPNETSVVFTNHLLSANNGVSTYDRYTYYRLLSQMGVESAPESGKMNLNYDNLDPGLNGNLTNNGTTSATNFVPWQPLTFFTNAADRMLLAYTTEWRNSNPTNFATTFYAVTNFNFNANQWTNYPAFGLHGAPGVIPGIPVLVSNQFVYTPAVQRVLQLAANIYDATTNNAFVKGKNFPSVFRPAFWVTNENGYINIYINGYGQVVSLTGTGDSQIAVTLDVNGLALLASSVGFGNWTNVNVYGVPWIIGAKKGFPNFNEFSMESIVGITRRLQVTRLTTNAPPPASVDFSGFRTNQMYTMCISNWLGVEFWNSYTNNYTPIPASDLTIVVRDNLSMMLTNDNGMAPVTVTTNFSVSISPLTTLPSWPGVLPWDGDGNSTNASFNIPFETGVAMLLNPNLGVTSDWWAYRFDTAPPQFLPASDNSLNPLFETDVSGFPFPHFILLTTNRLQVFMLDGTNVIDYAQFAGPDSSRDLNAEIFTDDENGVWNTNASTFGPPIGILNQISISRGSTGFPTGPPSEDGTWHGDPEAVPLGGTPPQQQAAFDALFRAGNIGRAPAWNGDSSATATNMETSAEAPYQPARYVVLYTTWQANDPLVHYIASDLNYTLNATGDALQPGTNTFNYGVSNLIPILPNIGRVNNHYMPWGRPMLAPGVDTNAYNLAVRDPLVWQSQDWDFPTYKFPTVGWMGRVHRGTPWQTVYLKSPDILNEIQMVGVTTNYIGTNTWAFWTGDAQLASGQYYDAVNAAPAQDRLLFDLFTTAFNDNATRGQLSVNVGASDPNNSQAGLAAWSALFSGVIALSNNVTPFQFFDPLTEGGVQHANSLTNFTSLSPINPAGPVGPGSVLGGLVAGINQTRTNFVNLDGLKGTFEHAGDVLSVPQLTDQSPFLNWNDALQQANGINDEMYEWLPQQVMSLLRVSGTPESPVRYVIYSYGQALKPAPNGIYTGSGQYFGMVTNYQVVAESATRTVVRFDGTRVGNVYQINSVTPPIWVNAPSMTNNNAQIERFNVLPPD